MSGGADIGGATAPLVHFVSGAPVTRTFRILCAVDATLEAAPAFEQALAMSVARRAQLVVVHAVRNTSYSWGAAERESALAALCRRAEALNVPVRIRTQQGETSGVILLHAHAQAADLIVLGSHEPIGLARYRFGSIADRVVRGATCPVLLVPAAAPVTPSFSKVVCAVDPSMLETQNVHADDVTMTVSATADEDDILRTARETTADLIVMGLSPGTGLRDRLLGSTAIRVARRSPIPVLILPAVQVKRTLSTLDQAALGWAA
jgi:nucleotide-binding universal stress UspA family protein